MKEKFSKIRTPDQRLRVFVSSTLKELAQEREAAQRAITNLRLIPVMFEIGARPYPSRALYRAYLDQSQVFIGIYWQQYGWIASNMDISGIEDEYVMAKDIPRLIYLKSPAPEIEQGLKTMIRRIQGDNSVSYKRFSHPDELQELIENDLALLLSEHFFVFETTTDRHASSLEFEDEQILGIEAANNLPLHPTQFIGRKQELDEICDLIIKDQARLVTLTGPGGTGKTRLGLAAAQKLIDDYDFQVIYIPLADLSDPKLVISKTAQVFGIREGGRPLLESLKFYLRDKELLILFDNFEQIIAGANVVAELLKINSKLKIMVTSRIVLRLQGEFEYPVAPLSLPSDDEVDSYEHAKQSEALQLFVSRAKASNPRFELNNQNILPISHICTKLDGLPLAIEIAAARIKMMTPEAILERLNERLLFLKGGPRDLPERQQAIRTTLDWSFSLLDKESQQLFARLGVFVGGFSLESVETVCVSERANREQSGENQDVIAQLELLLDNSLILVDGNAVIQPRFRMLETIRDYAKEQLIKHGEIDSLRDRHVIYFSSKSVEYSITKAQTNEAEFWLDWAEMEHDNLRAALSWCIERSYLLDLGPLFLSSLIWFWFRRGYLSEGREWAKQLLEIPVAKGKTQERVLTLFASSALAMWQGDLNFALSTIQETLEIARWQEIPYNLAVTFLFYGTILVNMGRDDEAMPLLEEALQLFDKLGLPWYSATTRVHIANSALGRGDIHSATEYLESASAESQALGEKWLISFVLNNHGELSRVKGDYERAKSYYQESEQLLREMGDKGELARLVHNLGSVAIQQGELNQAKRYFSESLEMFKKLGNQRGIAESMTAFAGLYIREGDFYTGIQLLSFANGLLNKTGGSWWPADRVDIERNHEKCRNNLDPQELKLAWEQGQEIELEKVLEMVETKL